MAVGGDEKSTAPHHRMEFSLDQRLVGISAHTATPGEKMAVITTALLPSTNPGGVAVALDALQQSLFSHIEGFPEPQQIRSVFVLIRPDLTGVAYVNAASLLANVRTTRDVRPGDPVFTRDIGSIENATVDLDLPADCALVTVLTFGWNRSVYFDFGPLHTDRSDRSAPLDQVLAVQLLGLLGLAPKDPITKTKVDEMASGFQLLRQLLTERCRVEARYQQVLLEHPWMLGGIYSRLNRHENLDDKNIPDFTAERISDGTLDVIELKQPFLSLFRSDGKLASDFNQAWNQAERYLAFVRDNRGFLVTQKDLVFDHPRCILLAGHQLTSDQRRELRPKLIANPAIVLLTYDELVEQARGVLSLPCVPT